MLTIRVRDGESIDSALRRFNAVVLADGVLRELKERSHYEKPSVRKRRIRKERRIALQNLVK